MPNNPLELLNVPKKITKGAVETRLPKPLRAELEKALDADFSSIKVMQSHLPTLNNSDTYVRGNELHFAPGKFDPHSNEGREVLAHELSHVIQQHSGFVSPFNNDTNDNDRNY